MVSLNYYKRFNYFFSLYLFTLLTISVFHLYFKHTGGADSTISEWLINYQGGFTKRGIIGEIIFLIAKFFNSDLRFIIFICQSLLIFFYFTSIYNFFLKLNINYYILLIIFSPIFLLYPIAELEVLARKEIFIFVGYIFFLNLCSNKEKKYDILFLIFLLPLLSLIWEPVVFFAPFFLVPLLIKYSIKEVKKSFKFIVYFLPFVFVSIYIALNPISDENHLKMVNSLANNFGEKCYMSCALLKSKSKIVDQFTYNFPLYSFEILIRYSLIVLVGFGPLFVITRNSSIKNTVIFFDNFKSLLFPFIILVSPLLLLFAMGSDWGRWVNITYTFATLFFIFLLKNNYIKIKYNHLDNFLKQFKKYVLVLFFIILCFSWNPKTNLTGDVASIPGYRIPYNFVKLIINEF